MNIANQSDTPGGTPATSTKAAKEITAELDSLLQYATAAEFRETITTIYLEYIAIEAEAGFPDNFAAIAAQMLVLIDFFRNLEPVLPPKDNQDT